MLNAIWQRARSSECFFHVRRRETSEHASAGRAQVSASAAPSSSPLLVDPVEGASGRRPCLRDRHCVRPGAKSASMSARARIPEVSDQMSAPGGIRQHRHPWPRTHQAPGDQGFESARGGDIRTAAAPCCGELPRGAVGAFRLPLAESRIRSLIPACAETKSAANRSFCMSDLHRITFIAVRKYISPGAHPDVRVGRIFRWVQPRPASHSMLARVPEKRTTRRQPRPRPIDRRLRAPQSDLSVWRLRMPVQSSSGPARTGDAASTRAGGQLPATTTRRSDPRVSERANGNYTLAACAGHVKSSHGTDGGYRAARHVQAANRLLISTRRGATNSSRHRHGDHVVEPGRRVATTSRRDDRSLAENPPFSAFAESCRAWNLTTPRRDSEDSGARRERPQVSSMASGRRLRAARWCERAELTAEPFRRAIGEYNVIVNYKAESTIEERAASPYPLGHQEFESLRSRIPAENWRARILGARQAARRFGSGAIRHRGRRTITGPQHSSSVARKEFETPHNITLVQNFPRARLRRIFSASRRALAIRGGLYSPR